MGLRFRKSIKILPGVRLNINKNSTSITAGFKGYHVTYNSKTGLSQTASIPGTGLSYTQRSSSQRKRPLSPEAAIRREPDPVKRKQLEEYLESEKRREKEIKQYIREREKRKQKATKEFERAYSLTKRENEILNIIKDLTYHISKKLEVEYIKNDFFVSCFYKFEPFWICRIVVKGRKNFIIFPTKENKTQMFEFKTLDDVYNYSELIKWSATNARKACLDVTSNKEKHSLLLRQKSNAIEAHNKKCSEYVAKCEHKRVANLTLDEQRAETTKMVSALFGTLFRKN